MHHWNLSNTIELLVMDWLGLVSYLVLRIATKSTLLKVYNRRWGVGADIDFVNIPIYFAQAKSVKLERFRALHYCPNPTTSDCSMHTYRRGFSSAQSHLIHTAR